MTACFIHSSLEHCNFWNTDDLQGSVLTQLRCGGIVNEAFVGNLLMNVSERSFFKNHSTFGKVMAKL